MARDVTVRLSADIAAYIQAMGQAEQATGRVADAADRLGDIRISADSSVSADLDQAASSADAAASSMEGASGAAESMSGGMNDAAASAQTAAGGMQEAGAASDDVAASVGNVSAASQDTAAAMMAVGGAAQDGAAGLQSAGAAGQDAGAGIESAASSAQVLASNLDGSGGSAQSFAASLSTVGAQSQDAAGSMQSLAGAAQDSAGGLDTAAGSAGSASGSMGGLLATAAGMQSEFRALGGSMAVVGGGLTAMTGHLIGVGIEYNNLQQVAGQALSTMTDSAADANAQMDRLNEFASTSPFFRDTWITAQQQLMAFGMEAENVVPTLEGIEEAVAAIGGGDQEIRQLVDILGQVQGQGRITGRELQRMGQMGIDAASIIGEHMGYTGDEIREQITAGALDAETAIDALATGMSTRFEGSADAIRNTFEGAKNDVIAFTRDIGSIIAAPLVNPEGGGFLVDIMNMAGDALLSLRELPAPLIQIAGLGTAAAGGITLLGGGLVAALPHLRNFATNAGTAWSAIGNFATGGAGVAGAVRRIGTAVGIAAAAWAAWEIVSHVGGDVDDFVGSLSDMERALLELSQGQQNATQDLVEFERGWSLLGTSVEGLGGAMERIDADRFLDGFRSFGASILPLTNDISAAEEAVARFDEATASAFSEGNFTLAAAGFQEVAAEAEALGLTADEVAEMYPQMTAAIRDAATAAESTATDQQLLGIATSEAALAALHAGEPWSVITQAYRDNYYAAADAGDGALSFRDALSQQAEAANEAADGISSLISELSAYGDLAAEARNATYDWLDTLDESNERLSEGSISLDENTDSGRENLRMLDELRTGSLEAAAAAAAQEEGLSAVRGRLQEGVSEIEAYGEAAGYSTEEIEALVRETYSIPEHVPIDMWVEDRATEIIEGVSAHLDGVEDEYTILLEAQDDHVQDTIRAIEDGDYEAVADILGDDELAQAAIDAFEDGHYQAVIDLLAEAEAAQAVIYDFMAGEYVAQLDINGNPDEANQVIAAIMNGDYDALVEIIGEDVDASAAIEAIVSGDHQALVDILGDDELAQGVMTAFTDAPWMAQVLLEALTAGAESDLEGTTRPRTSEITGIPYTDNARRDLDDASVQRLAEILGIPLTDNAEARMNDTARSRIASILADPDTWTAEGELTNTARGRIADIFADPDTWAAEGDLNDTSRPRTAPVDAEARTAAAEAALNYLARNRDSILTVTQVTRMANTGASANRPVGYALGGLVGRAAGGLVPPAASLSHIAGGYGPLPGYSDGGRLPYTGLGTDRILGINSYGVPTAWVDDGEFVTREEMTRKHLGALQAINDDNMPALKSYASRLAEGGIAGAHQPRSFQASRQPIMATPAAQQAAESGPRVVFQQTNHNPLRETDIEAARRQVEAVGMDWDMSTMGGDR